MRAWTTFNTQLKPRLAGIATVLSTAYDRDRDELTVKLLIHGEPRRSDVDRPMEPDRRPDDRAGEASHEVVVTASGEDTSAWGPILRSFAKRLRALARQYENEHAELLALRRWQRELIDELNPKPGDPGLPSTLADPAVAAAQVRAIRNQRDRLSSTMHQADEHLGRWEVRCLSCPMLERGSYSRVVTYMTIHVSSTWPDTHSCRMMKVPSDH